MCKSSKCKHNWLTNQLISAKYQIYNMICTKCGIEKLY